MPYITDKIALKDPFLDRRVKLIPCQREMVHYWFRNGLSINKIAKTFKVNKRLIQFELFPERRAKNLSDRQDRGGTSIYYKGGEGWNKTMREHRKYKYTTLNNQPLNN